MEAGNRCITANGQSALTPVPDSSLGEFIPHTGPATTDQPAPLCGTNIDVGFRANSLSRATHTLSVLKSQTASTPPPREPPMALALSRKLVRNPSTLPAMT